MRCKMDYTNVEVRMYYFKIFHLPVVCDIAKWKFFYLNADIGANTFTAHVVV